MIDDTGGTHAIIHASIVHVGGLIVVEELNLVTQINQLGQRIGIIRQLACIGILDDHVRIRCHHIGVNRNNVTGHKAVEISCRSLGIAVLVHVVILDDGILIVQRPFSLLHRLVKIGKLIIFEQILVVDGKERIAEHGDRHGAGGQKLHFGVSKRHHIVVTLRPIMLIRVDMIQFTQIDISSFHSRDNSLKGTIRNDVVFTETTRDIVIELHIELHVSVSRIHLQLNTELFLNQNVSLVDRIRHNTHAILTHQLVTATANIRVQDPDGLTAIVQIGRQVTGKIRISGFTLRSLRACIPVQSPRRILCALGASHRREQHKCH